MTQLHAGLAPLNLPARFAEAKRRIILHAAVYGPFAESIPHRDGLQAALGKDSFLSLDVVALQRETVWTDAFLSALRFGAAPEDRVEALTASATFLQSLKDAHPGKVHLHRQDTFPCLPLVVVDDTVIFGQYAHSDALAAKGFWGLIETDVDALFQWAAGDGPPDDATDEDAAAYRLICECRHAMHGDVRHGDGHAGGAR